MRIFNERSVEIGAGEIIPSIDSVLRLMGVPREARGDEDRRARIPFDDACRVFLAEAAPRAVFGEIRPGDGVPALFGGSPSSPLKKRLAKAPRAVAFAATVGPGPERQASRYMGDGRYLFATTLDALASEAVERLVDRIQSMVGHDLGLGACVRFSPGYGGWRLEAQVELLGSLSAADIGIELTESLMMLPRKSVSGLVVPRDAGESTSPCAMCKRKDCGMRRL